VAAAGPFGWVPGAATHRVGLIVCERARHASALLTADIAPIRTIGSMQLRRKRFDRPGAVRAVEKARIELVELGDLAVGRAIFEPG
jgi:hypothetical protein